MKIVGHESVLDRLLVAYSGGTLAHAYLFVGPKNIGKTMVAKYLASIIFCQEKAKEPCHKCDNCKLFLNQSQPDFFINDDESTFGVDNTRELIKFLDLAPYRSRHKVALITNAERLTEQAANAFLKTLEEPTGQTIIILTSQKEANLLPTITSRCQLTRFNSPEKKKTSDFLQKELAINTDKAERLMALSANRIGLAIKIGQDEKIQEKLSTMIEKFEDISTKSYQAKFGFSEEYSKSKNLIDDLEILENYYYQKIDQCQDNPRQRLKIIAILDKIAKSKEYYYQNINTGLILESLVI